MKIEKVEMIAFKVYAKCDKCEKGNMETTKETLLSYPPQYKHKCNRCGYEAYYREQYPRMIYEEKPKKIIRKDWRKRLWNKNT